MSTRPVVAVASRERSAAAKRTKSPGDDVPRVSAAGTGNPAARTLARLEREFGSFDVTTEETVVPRATYTDCLRAFESGALGGVRTFVYRDGAVLLVRYDYEPAVWELPGGSTDRAERFTDTARARVHEDTGVSCSLTGVVRVLREQFTLVEDGDGVTGLWVFFEADSVDDHVEPGDDVLEAAWVDTDALPKAVAPEIEAVLG